MRRQIAAHARQWAFPAGCSPYAPADWHVTLHFIGALDRARLCAVAASAAVPLEPFELVFDRPQLWPRGLAVLCASAVPDALRELHGSLGGVLRGLHLAVDARPCRPHLTLARRAGGAIAPSVCAPVCWPARTYVLAASTGGTDPRYRVLRQYG